MQRKKVELLLITTMMFLAPYVPSVCVYADGDPLVADSVEEQTDDNEETGDTASRTDYSADEVMDLISSLEKEKEPDTEDIENTKEAYESLSMADKLKVENYDTLESIVSAAGLDDEEYSISEDSSTQVNGTEYTFSMSEYVSQVTLTIRYVVDTDGDGNMDMPDITVTSPSGETYTIGEQDSVLSNDECNADIIQTDNYLQFNIAQAVEGTWQVETSERVIFELSDYAGDEKAENFASSETSKEQDEEQDDSADPNKEWMKLGLMVAVLIALIVGWKKMTDPKKKKEEKEDAVQRLTPEEEIEQIKAQWAKEEDRFVDKKKVKEDKPPVLEVSDQTIIDTGNDDVLLTEFDAGFFEHSRFAKEDE